MNESELQVLASEQHGVFSRRQARDHGMSGRRVEHVCRVGRWIRVHPGIYRIAGAPPSWSSHLVAACLADETGLASHRSAARLWQLRGFARDEGIEITVPPGHARALRAVRVHQCKTLLPTDRRILDAVPVTAPELTLLHLGAGLPPARIDGLVDEAIRRGLTTLPKLRWRLRVLGRRGRNGTAGLRAVLDARDPQLAAAESRLERRFLALVRRSGLPAPTLQHPIRRGDGIVARIDAAWVEQRIAVELDSAEFHRPVDRWSADLVRQNALVAEGWTPLRFTWWAVKDDPDDVIASLHAVLQAESSRIRGSMLGERREARTGG